MRVRNYTINELRAATAAVAECEKSVNDSILALIDEIERRQAKLILIAGPSCSCKTSLTNAADALLESRGHISTEISMDDFYKNHEDCPVLADGSIDIESLGAIDTALLNSVLADLVAGRPAEVPQFDFHTSKRKNETKTMTSDKNGVIIVEGINALNPSVAENINHDKIMRVYVCPNVTVSGENGLDLLGQSDVRFIRRAVRDMFYRGASAEVTLGMWEGVLRGERENIEPYIPNADVCINTFYPYELSVLKDTALDILPDSHPLFSDMLGRVRSALAAVETMEMSKVPPLSLLQEFIKY